MSRSIEPVIFNIISVIDLKYNRRKHVSYFRVIGKF